MDIIKPELTCPIDKEVVIAPPSIYLIPVKEIVRKDIKVAAQNCYFKESGAFTGEIRCDISFSYSSDNLTRLRSPKQLVNAGIPYVILGARNNLGPDLFLTSYRPLGTPNTLP